MTAEFVPFSSSIAARLSAQANEAPALSLISAEAVPHKACDKREIKVELKKDGERITQIRIHCRCGELIELDCQY